VLAKKSHLMTTILKFLVSRQQNVTFSRALRSTTCGKGAGWCEMFKFL
jgi:hypothetical protein